jgi:DNA-binding ferritin-like protein
MIEEKIINLVRIQTQFKFLHWQTMGDAKHRLYGDVYSKLGDYIDEFVEIMMGKYGRPTFNDEFIMSFQDISAVNMQVFIDEIVEYLVDMSTSLDAKYDTDLLNIRDEMLGLINKTKYLLTLKY